MNRLAMILIAVTVVASGCMSQDSGSSAERQFVEINGLEVSYTDSVSGNYVERFTSEFNGSEDIDRVAITGEKESFRVKIFTRHSSVEDINNLDTEETASYISREAFNGSEVELQLATVDGEVAQKASTD